MLRNLRIGSTILREMTVEIERQFTPKPPELQPATQAEFELLAIGPMDGRYRKDALPLIPWLSEWGLLRTRCFVEAEYVKALSSVGIIPALEEVEKEFLVSIATNFSIDDGLRVKELEKTTGHDVVAVINFIKEKLMGVEFGHLAEFIHIGPTSEDIDNLAVRINVRNAIDTVLFPGMESVIGSISNLANDTKDAPMIARTHGQVAAADTFGRKMLVFVDRLQRQMEKVKRSQFDGKFNGIVGTWSGFRAAFPEMELEQWIAFSHEFIESFGFTPIDYTSQSNPNDDIADMLQTIQRFDNILHGFGSDIWDYISGGYLKQKPEPGSSGSSTGAAKVNPWRQEHAGAMLRLAPGLAGVLVDNIVEYRLERQITDKTLLRFLGEILSVNLNAWRYTTDGLALIQPNLKRMNQTIYQDVSYLSEALQLILRKHGVATGYEIVKRKTQGREFTPRKWASMIEKLIKELKLTDEDVIRQLRSLSPQPFIDDARKLTEILPRASTE